MRVAVFALLISSVLLGCGLRSQVEPGANDTPSSMATVGLETAVLEYFYHRKKALLAGDPQLLWKRYPELAQGGDPQSGVNDEGRLVQSLRALRMIDVDFDLDRVERVRYSLSGQNAEATIHGLYQYLLADFNRTAGEFKMTLYLRLGSDRWNVVRTDDVTLSEWHEEHRSR